MNAERAPMLFPAAADSPKPAPVKGLSSAVIGAWVRFDARYHALHFRGRLGITAYCGAIAGYDDLTRVRPPGTRPSLRVVCKRCLNIAPGAYPEART